MNYLTSIATIVILIYVGFGALLYFFQERMIFLPNDKIVGSPKEYGLQYENIFFATSDGVKLNAWFIPAKNAKLTLLFCHGNAGNISHRLETLQLLQELNVNVFIFDYRGYGQSEGFISEKGTYLDAQAALKYLVEKKNISLDNIIIKGRSLGGGIASELASKHQVKGLILESTFSSMPDVAQSKYPFYPKEWITRIKYRTIKHIKQIKCPKLIIHSSEDEIIPFSHGQRIFKASTGDKTFIELKGLHNECYFSSRETYFKALKSFFNKVH